MSIEPTFEEELTRKAGEALSWLDNEYKRGSVNGDTFRLCLSGIDFCTLGLIPLEYSDWASAARESALNPRYPDKVVLTLLGVATLVVELDRELGEIRFIKISDKKGIERKTVDIDEQDTVKGASRKFPELIDSLIKKGFEVVK